MIVADVAVGDAADVADDVAAAAEVVVGVAEIDAAAVVAAEFVVAAAFGAWPPEADVPAYSPADPPPGPGLPLCCTSENRDVAAAASDWMNETEYGGSTRGTRSRRDRHPTSRFSTADGPL